MIIVIFWIVVFAMLGELPQLQSFFYFLYQPFFNFFSPWAGTAPHYARAELSYFFLASKPRMHSEPSLTLAG